MNEKQPPCAYRDPSILNDPDVAEAYMSELPQGLDSDSTEAEIETLMARPVCDPSRCRLNLGMVLRHLTASGSLEPLEAIARAVPPDCAWHDTHRQNPS